MPEGKGEEMKCGWCGKEYDSGRKNTKYCCDECRKAAAVKGKKEREKKYRKRRVEEAKKKLNRNRKPNAEGLSLSEVNALAREEGLTYGKYLAKHGLY